MGFQFLWPERMAKWRDHVYNHHKSRGRVYNDMELELRCFAEIPFGHDLKGEFCLSLARMRWDFLYLEADGIENYWFTRMMRTLCRKKKVFMVGSASAGKTAGASIWGMNMWAVAPWNTTFLVTSTDTESLKSKIFKQIRDLNDKDAMKIGSRIDYEDAIVANDPRLKKASERDLGASIKAIALPQGSEGEKAIGKVQGRKNENIIWAADEYAHMDKFVQTARGNLRHALSFHFVACSNKPEEGDPMFQDAMPDPEQYPMGWETPGLQDLEGWDTVKGGYCLYFDGEKSPNTLAEPGAKDPFPMLTRREVIEETRKEDGEDSVEWWRYIKAFPKPGEAHDKVIDHKFLERYKAFEKVIWAGPMYTTVAGLDAAWTHGGDDCMAAFGKVGIDSEGVKVLSHEANPVKLNVKVSGKGTFEEQLSDAFISECKTRECHVVAIDISGSGGRMANALRDAATKSGWKLEIVAVDSAGAADPNEMYEVGDEQKSGDKLFDRRVSEVWVGYRLDVKRGLIRGVDINSKWVKELCERRVSTDENKRWVVESKKLYKKRNMGKSPDSAEACVLCRFAARKNGLGASVRLKTEPITLSELSSPLKDRTPYSYGQPKKAAYTTR